MSEFEPASGLPSELRRDFILEAQKANLAREVSQAKRQIKRQVRRLSILTAISLLLYGVSKWIWPDVSIYLFFSWVIEMLFEGVVLARNMIKARKALRAWNGIMTDCNRN